MSADNAPVQMGGIAWHVEADRPDDLWLDATAGPSGTPALIIRAFPSKEARWVSAPMPVEPGRAYVSSARVRSGLVNTEGRLELVFRDADGKELTAPTSRSIFWQHDFAAFDVTAVAPDRSRDVLLRFAVFGTRGDSGGQAMLAAPAFGPAISLWVGLDARGHLIPPGKPAPAAAVLAGLPDGLAVDLTWQVLDFDARPVPAASGKLASTADRKLAFSIPALTPGYYMLSVRAEAQGLTPASREVSLGVIDALAAKPPPTTPICLDAGFSWGCATDAARLDLAAYVCEFAGLRELRDRLSWWGVEQEEGKLSWGQYAAAAEAQARHGITVYQIFHECPPWAAVPVDDKQQHNNYPPRDPIYVYRMVNRLVHDLGRQVRYFEVWNEPNIGFFFGRPEDYAAVLKAAYLGAKDADPNFGVLIGSAAGGPGPFYDRVYENATGDYFDIYNQHWYGSPEQLFGFMAGVRNQLENHGIVGRPTWMTEMGFPVHPASDGSFGAPERAAASYLLRAYACGFATGFARFHYFYFQEYLEGSVSLWGIVRVDLTPKPAYVALATLVRQLGEARCLGWTRLPNDGYAVYFRRAPGVVVAIAWSGKPSELRLPARGPVVDMVGREVKPARSTGPLANMTIDLGPNPVFVRGLREEALAALKLEKPVPAPDWTPAPDPHLADKRVWLQLEVNPDKLRPAGWPAEEEKMGVLINPGEKFTVAAWVNNYSDKPANVSVTCAPDRMFALDGPADAALTVGSWQRARHDFVLTGRNMVVGQTMGVSVTMKAPRRAEKCRAYVRTRATDLQPGKRFVVFDGEAGADDWADNSSPALKTTVALDPEVKHAGAAALRVESTVVSADDCWAFPRLHLPAGLDLGKFTGLELWSYVAPGQEGTRTLDVQLVEDGGGTYWIPSVRSLSQPGWHRALVSFSSAQPTQWGPDPDGKLDLSKVRDILVGWGGYRGRVGERLVFWLDDISAASW